MEEMIREFKFKAFHKPKKRIFDVYSLSDDSVFENSVDGIFTSPTLPAKREDCILMQYTGLKDKNGVEIYEGDIAMYQEGYAPNDDSSISVVKFCDRSGSWFWEDENLYYFKDRLVVIGNIHENPELLEVEK